MNKNAAKILGQFFTPLEVASTLVRWVVQSEKDRLLDPSCGDGRFLRQHRRSVGIDTSGVYCRDSRLSSPWAEVHEADFFEWADTTRDRFQCAAGNPPFIRYQNFSGKVRDRALSLCAREGAKFSALTSSWAPFIIAAGGLLEPGGRMAFVVPAEIGHSNYAIPLMNSLVEHFQRVLVVAIREKIFPDLSEDVWILYAEGRGGKTRHIEMDAWERFQPAASPPDQTRKISLETFRRHGSRLRKFLLPDPMLDYYLHLSGSPDVVNFGSIARIGIGYVTGANDFFHLKPSDAERLGIPKSLLKVAVRKGEQLPSRYVDDRAVKSWIDADEPVLLLYMSGIEGQMPKAVESYLDSDAAMEARQSYKCRNRDPWYVVPDVSPPDAFLSYMSGKRPNFVSNPARCVCTNSIHAVRFRQPVSINSILKAWEHPLSDLSKEVEGHPLGGGLLKLEPREAGRILLPIHLSNSGDIDVDILKRGVEMMQSWRHYV